MQMVSEKTKQILEEKAKRLEDLEERISASLNRIPAGVAEQVGYFALFNSRGSKAPFFWCFNGLAEPILLAEVIGKDQPFYAMISAHSLLPKELAHISSYMMLSDAYAELVEKINLSGRIMIGGNCQAGPIAEMICHRLYENGRSLPLLFTLEHDLRYTYPGAVYMLFGENSLRQNPFLQGKHPVAGWRRKFGKVGWSEIPGDHGQYFKSPNIQHLSAHIKFANAMFHITGAGPSGWVRMTPDDLMPAKLV